MRIHELATKQLHDHAAGALALLLALGAAACGADDAPGAEAPDVGADGRGAGEAEPGDPAPSDGGASDPAVGSGDNLLINPGFEEGADSDGCPVGWTCVTYPADRGAFSVDGEAAHRGSYAGHWRGDDVGEAPSSLFRQENVSAPGRHYEVSAWYRSVDQANPPFIQVLFFDSSGDVIDDERFDGARGTSDWTRIVGTTTGAPAGTVSVRFNLTTEDSQGSVWWDEAALVDVSPPGLDMPDVPDVPDVGEPPEDAIHLCDEGLSEGDLINPHLEAHLTDGATLVVCRGTYRLERLSLSGNDWTVIAPEGATLRISGTTILFTTGRNYRLSGFVFDQREGGGHLRLVPSGDDWIVDHLAWQGEHPGGGRLLAPSVASPDATGLIDRIYMGDGQAEGTESGAVWVDANTGHYGDLTFRRVYMAHFIDNAVYGTGPGTKGQPGRTHVEDSFFWSNTISNARTGALRGTCYVRRSVFVLDGTTQACGVGCSNPGARTTRGVWAWHGRVVVEDSDFTVTHGSRVVERSGATLIERGNRVGAAARTEPPEGVPTSPDAIYENPPGWAEP